MRTLLRALAAVSAVLAVLAVTSCGTSSEANGTVVQVSPDRAVVLLETGDPTVVDLRRAGEFNASHVVGAVNIDAAAPDFEERVAKLDKDARYVVYARTREESRPAADVMARAGIERIVDAGAFGLLALAGAPLG